MWEMYRGFAVFVYESCKEIKLIVCETNHYSRLATFSRQFIARDANPSRLFAVK